MLRAGYRYGFSLSETDPFKEYRPILEQTYHEQLPLKILPKRFGLVAYGGVGGVARHLNEFRMDQLLPAAGAGARFRLTKESHVNFRVDLAVGRNGHTVTIGVGEAF